MPRFIISVRELYDRDFRNRLYGIDTGFGVVSQLIASGNAGVSAISFADANPEEGQAVDGNADDLEAIQLEVVGDSARRV